MGKLHKNKAFAEITLGAYNKLILDEPIFSRTENYQGVRRMTHKVGGCFVLKRIKAGITQYYIKDINDG